MLERDILGSKCGKSGGFCRNNIKAIQVISHALEHTKILINIYFHSPAFVSLRVFVTIKVTFQLDG